MNKEIILTKNLEALGKYNFGIINDLINLDFSNIENVGELKTSIDSATVFIKKDSKIHLLHSVYNPIEDASRLIKNIDFNKDSLIIVFGIGLGYHLLELKKKITKDTRIFIVEHNVDVLKYALKNVDLTEIFNSNQIFLLFGADNTINYQILAQVGHNFYNMAYNIQIIMLPNYYIYADSNIKVMKQITNRISSTIVSQGNALDDMFVGFRNNYLNVDAMIKCNCIDEIKDKYKNKPAIIVASGPSLDKNIEYLKNAVGKALIIACDASLNICEANGVKPDAIASIERDEPTYTYYYKDRKIDEDIVLVAPGLLWPQIYEEYKGKTIIMSKTSGGNEGWWHKHFENTRHVNQGQSSAHVAFAVAKEAGCNPIILIGQDLAYTYGKKHSDMAHTDHEGDNDDRDAKALGEVFLEDYEGNLLKSNWIYKIFKTWFENQAIVSPEIEIIDATEGGAYKEGTKIMKLKDAIENYCTSPLKIRMVDYLKDISIKDREKLEKYNVIIKNTEKEIKKLIKIKKISSEHLKVLKKLDEKYKFEECTEDELKQIIIKMQPGDKIIQQILHSQEALNTYYVPIITQTIMEVKKIGNVLSIENVIRNHELQRNLMYMIDKSTDLIIDEYNKALEFIIMKKNELEKKL